MGGGGAGGGGGVGREGERDGGPGLFHLFLFCVSSIFVNSLLTIFPSILDPFKIIYNIRCLQQLQLHYSGRPCSTLVIFARSVREPARLERIGYRGVATRALTS